MVESEFVDISDKSVVHQLFKQMRNIVSADTRGLSHFFQSNTVAVVLVDVMSHSEKCTVLFASHLNVKDLYILI